jgi:hypothetical protein
VNGETRNVDVEGDPPIDLVMSGNICRSGTYGTGHGSGRKPAPGTQKAFGELIAAWIETGAACPDK